METSMTLVHRQGVLEWIGIKREIFEGDLLSPILFTVSLYLLSKELQKTGYGYQFDEKTKINHLFYVDDFKLHERNDSQLNRLVNRVKMVSDDIKMEFGINKYVQATFKKGKKVSTERIKLADKNVIQKWEPPVTYTYLGIKEGDGTEQHNMKIWNQE